MKSIEESLQSCHETIQVDKDEKGNLCVSSIFSFPGTFSGFDGHFPGNPILPAIIQLSSVRYLAEKVLQRKLLPQSFARTKFRAMIKPDQKVHIKLNLDEIEEHFKCKFTIHSDKKETIASGHCVLTETLS